jgi:hypothetical protein
MSEDKLHESIARGARAEALLQNDLLQEAFAPGSSRTTSMPGRYHPPATPTAASGCGKPSTSSPRSATTSSRWSTTANSRNAI